MTNAGNDEEWDPDALLYVPGVPYVAAWQEAREVAEHWGRVAKEVGAEIQAQAITDAQGRGVVELRGSQQIMCMLAQLVLRGAREGKSDG
ncbi:hypothetical protein OYE22_10920 [Streptomyces sp. 71268]|uniref:hypothetical protein n=1 Tax=Streptomyces sp. 71268 TaxID=3002640 RepID=UPI0023F6DC2E|nr:hypothetical protein [Streptomyces sp. 71268]WEV25651.1 hypothetical protein OYE22_10920 [Streptomyces sp. 71268]